MSDRIKPTIVLIVVLCLALAAFFLLKPSPAKRIVPKQEVALGFVFAIDPHLMLTVEPVSVGYEPGAEFLLPVKAGNTAAGDLKINLSDLRFAVVEADEEPKPVAATWMTEDGKPLDGGVLLRGQVASAEVRLQLPERRDAGAVVIWREEKFYRWLPFMRESILNTRLRIEMADLVNAAK